MSGPAFPSRVIQIDVYNLIYNYHYLSCIAKKVCSNGVPGRKIFIVVFVFYIVAL